VATGFNALTLSTEAAEERACSKLFQRSGRKRANNLKLLAVHGRCYLETIGSIRQAKADFDRGAA